MTRDHVVSSLRITRLGGHDHVDVWSRGGKSGTLVANAGDGPRFAAKLIRPFAPLDMADPLVLEALVDVVEAALRQDGRWDWSHPNA